MTTELAETLRSTSTESLLTTFAALTHRIHEAQRAPITRGQTGDWEDDLQTQRDLIQAEILRRCAGYTETEK